MFYDEFEFWSVYWILLLFFFFFEVELPEKAKLT